MVAPTLAAKIHRGGGLVDVSAGELAAMQAESDSRHAASEAETDTDRAMAAVEGSAILRALAAVLAPRLATTPATLKAEMAAAIKAERVGR